MIKSSSKRSLPQRESTVGESSAGETSVNGLMRATERAKASVAVDGFRTCYKCEPYFRMVRGDGFPSTWVAPQELITQSCPMILRMEQGFFVCGVTLFEPITVPLAVFLAFILVRLDVHLFPYGGLIQNVYT